MAGRVATAYKVRSLKDGLDDAGYKGSAVEIACESSGVGGRREAEERCVQAARAARVEKDVML